MTPEQPKQLHDIALLGQDLVFCDHNGFEYRVTHRKGHSHYSEHYIAERRENNHARRIFMKYLWIPTTIGKSDAIMHINRLTEEAMCLERLRGSTRIVQGLGTIEWTNSSNYHKLLLQEYVDGTDLFDAIANKDPRLTHHNRLRVAKDIMGAAREYSERSVLHRDIKPSNVLVTPSGKAILCDFGNGVRTDIHGHRLPSQWYSRAYAAPEHVHGEYTEQSEVYALGLTLIALLALENMEEKLLLDNGLAKPIDERHSIVQYTINNLPTDKTGRIKTGLKYATELNPARRPESIEELAEELRFDVYSAMISSWLQRFNIRISPQRLYELEEKCMKTEHSLKDEVIANIHAKILSFTEQIQLSDYQLETAEILTASKEVTSVIHRLRNPEKALPFYEDFLALCSVVSAKNPQQRHIIHDILLRISTERGSWSSVHRKTLEFRRLAHETRIKLI